MALAWFKSYLGNRQQYVYNKTNSNAQNISCGVPQGSVIGPLLFIMYTNDLHTSITSNCIIFAEPFLSQSQSQNYFIEPYTMKMQISFFFQ